ncbi:hypothetical protein, partial [Stenotrophomonas maltophilia]|uniref:hypothetical protein n=1 Tax=Stenotrophomonas maltophilia TaxID=40324 RepID=UPI001953298A
GCRPAAGTTKAHPCVTWIYWPIRLPASGRHYQSASMRGVDLLADSIAGQRPALPKRVHA